MGWRNVSATPLARARTENGWRRAAGHVSAWRAANQTQSTAAISTNDAKMARQLEMASTPCPMEGASTGTMMKTVETKDITRAMPRPAYTSRTKAIDTMRGPAAPNPASVRPINSQPKLCVVAHSKFPSMNMARPANNVGRRPMLSETGPHTSCPIDMPTKNVLSTS